MQYCLQTFQISFSLFQADDDTYIEILFSWYVYLFVKRFSEITEKGIFKYVSVSIDTLSVLLKQMYHPIAQRAETARTEGVECIHTSQLILIWLVMAPCYGYLLPPRHTKCISIQILYMIKVIYIHRNEATSAFVKNSIGINNRNIKTHCFCQHWKQSGECSKITAF